ncbi:MAG: IMPACT family protein [Methylococcales bacterium]
MDRIGREIVAAFISLHLRYDQSMMYCVRSSSTAEEIIKKSRFVSYMIPCSSIEDIQKALKHLAAKHPGATHIAFAYRIKTEAEILSRFSDAGEPGGTAGKPILRHIEVRNLINCLVAVARYFGGIKLGAGGLARAYGNAAVLAIEANTLVPFGVYRRIPVTIDYPQLRNFEYHLKNWGGNIQSRAYGERIELLVSLPEPKLRDLKKLIDAKRS